MRSELQTYKQLKQYWVQSVNQNVNWVLIDHRLKTERISNISLWKVDMLLSDLQTESRK